MKKMVIFLSFLLLTPFFCQFSMADHYVREKIGPNAYKTYRVKDPEVKPKINWKERTTTKTSGSDVYVRKEILHETVCFDYEKGSIIYRNCRQDAKELFNQKCDYFDKKYRESKRPYDKEYLADRDMFCRSASSFSP